MIIGRLTPVSRFEIRQPRWHDRRVLLAKFRVGTHNEIVFTEADSLKGSFYMSGEDIRKHPLTDNGKIPCYAIPLDDLEPLERSSNAS